MWIRETGSCAEREGAKTTTTAGPPRTTVRSRSAMLIAAFLMMAMGLAMLPSSAQHAGAVVGRRLAQCS